MKKLLGLCIPTYNRASQLRSCLGSITEQFSSKGLPIYILDDASNDDTPAVIDNARTKYEGIVVKRNKTNLGMYLNSLRVAQMADTEYVWFMGDDDMIIGDGLERVISYLKDGYDFVVLNSIAFHPNMNEVKKGRIIEAKHDRVYPLGSHGKLLADLSRWAYHGFMTSMVIRKSLLLRYEDLFEKTTSSVFNNNWLPLMMFYSGIVGKSGVFIAEPIIYNRADNRYWRKSFWQKSIIGRIRALEFLQSCSYDLYDLRNAVGLTLKDIIFFGLIAKYSDSGMKLCDEYVRQSEILSPAFKLITLGLDHLPYFTLPILVGILRILKPH